MNKILQRTVLFSKSRNYKTFRSISTEKFNNDNYYNKQYSRQIFYGIVGVATCVGIYEFYDNRYKNVYAASKTKEAGDFRIDLPIYSIPEISTHNEKENKIWVIYKRGVYDVTEFIESHPGGEIILMAAGSSIEPYWMIYGIHKSEHVFDMLEEMRIGNICEDDFVVMKNQISDPYSMDPSRDENLLPASKKPFNAEPHPASVLVENFITPNNLFYVRNHLPVPVVNENFYELEVQIEGVDKKQIFRLDDLKKFQTHDVTATIMCAGNRRSEMSKVKQVKGLNWNQCAIGNAVWTGVLLRDVLISIGITDDDQFKHVQFEGLDVDPLVEDKRYGASIPFHNAMNKDGDVLLAFEMNGETLPRDHGFPLRVIVPGVCGARNVKWLRKIIVSNSESPAFWQQNDYKSFNPSVDFNTADFKKARAIQQLPVTSAICLPIDGQIVDVKDGCIYVKGYAWSGGGQQIYRVDVSADFGKTWHVANFDRQNDAKPPKHWSWTLWSANIPIERNTKQIEIWVRAMDSSHNTQPETFQHIWNIRGVLSNAYHRITINLK